MVKEELLQELDTLRIAYIKLLNDKDVLLHWGKPQLEALYQTRIGVHKLELLTIQLQIHATRRKLEMVRSSIQTQQPIQIEIIEMLVAIELEQAQHNIQVQADLVADGEMLLSNLGSPTRSAELRDMYKFFAKQLHPDATGVELNDEMKALWHRVQHAYKSGDAETLQALKLAYSAELQTIQNSVETLSEEELNLQVETLKEGVKVLTRAIEKIRIEFPFSIEHQIKDEDWVLQEVTEIKAEIEQLQKVHEQQLAELNYLLKEYE